MIAQTEQGFLAAQAEFEELLKYVRAAGRRGEAMHKVEGNLWEGMLRVGLATLEGFVEGQGDGDVGPRLQLEDGRVVKRQEALHPRRYVSVFGELTITRAVYGKRKKQRFEAVPLDARLELPEGDFSYLLQDWDQSHCVEQPFAKASESIRKILKQRQSVRSLEHMSQEMAQEVEGFRERQPQPPAREEGELMVVMADSKGIPMRREGDDARPADPRHLKKGEKKNKKRMACVGASYTVDRFIRTPEQVMREVLHKEVEAERPKPQHKRLRAELTREENGEVAEGKERVFAWLRTEIEQRHRPGYQMVVFLSDGEKTLEERAQEQFQGIYYRSVLDIMHVTSRLWEAAHCFHAEGSAEAQEFVKGRLQRLLEGEVDGVIRGLRQMATKRALRGQKAKTIARVTQYYENHRDRMHYDEYLASGYPIGTGPVEGACRNLIKDRMERTGMRWSVPGAQAMLDLRATYLNGDWDAYCQHRIHHETHRLYPYRKLLSTVPWNYHNAPTHSRSSHQPSTYFT